MKGTKRFAVSDSNHDTDDLALRNKRVMEGSQFGAHMAETSVEQSIATPPLDLQRAESSRQHVRALNIQFASWVQTQLKNNSDELWEDGVRDYLSHASYIMEKYADIINWLKAKTVKEEKLPAAGKKMMPETNNNNVKTFQAKSGFTPLGATTSFAASWSSGPLSNNQSSKGVLPSNQNYAGEPSNNQSSKGAFFNNQSSAGVFPSQGSSGVFFNSPNSGVLSNNQNSGQFSNNQSSGQFFNNQSSGQFSNNQSSGQLSNKQSSGQLSINQSSGQFSSTESSGPFLSTQTSSFFSNAQSSSSSSNNSQSFGLFSNNQSSILFGNQSSAPQNRDASNADGDENDLEQPDSPSVKKSEEQGVDVVHEVKCKLYVKSIDPVDKDAWKDKGTGNLSIKCKEGVSKGTKESKPTIVIRNDAGRLLLNALLYPGIKTNKQKNSVVAIFHTSGDGDGNGGDNNNVVAQTCLIRLKTEEDRNKLDTVIQEYAPST